MKKLDFNASGNGGGGGDISFRLTSSDLEELSAAARELKQKLATYEGVYDIADNFSSGSHEIRLKIRPEAEALGLTLSDLARQVRYGFYGYEAQRILRNKEEIKVMVRYPLEQRRTVGYLENMLIRTPQGKSVPFSTVAEVEKANPTPQSPVSMASGQLPLLRMPTNTRLSLLRSLLRSRRISCRSYRPSIRKSKPPSMAAAWMNRMLWSV